MSVVLPAARLLIACALVILFPVVLAATHTSPAWLLLPLVPVSATSCALQRFLRPGLVAACVASNAAMLAAVYLAARLVFLLID